MHSLASFVLINPSSVHVWHGRSSRETDRKDAVIFAKSVVTLRELKMEASKADNDEAEGKEAAAKIEAPFEIVGEGEETDAFWAALPNKELVHPYPIALAERAIRPRLFEISNASGMVEVRVYQLNFIHDLR